MRGFFFSGVSRTSLKVRGKKQTAKSMPSLPSSRNLDENQNNKSDYFNSKNSFKRTGSKKLRRTKSARRATERRKILKEDIGSPTAVENTGSRFRRPVLLLLHEKLSVYPYQ